MGTPCVSGRCRGSLHRRYASRRSEQSLLFTIASQCYACGRMCKFSKDSTEMWSGITDLRNSNLPIIQEHTSRQKTLPVEAHIFSMKLNGCGRKKPHDPSSPTYRVVRSWRSRTYCCRRNVRSMTRLTDCRLTILGKDRMAIPMIDQLNEMAAEAADRIQEDGAPLAQVQGYQRSLQFVLWAIYMTSM